MRRLTVFLMALCLLTTVFLLTAQAAQEDIPSLSSISFNGAKLDEEFSPEVNDYTITLENPKLTPTLKSYTIDGIAELFFTYQLNAAKHQTGILVTLDYDGGSVEYSFVYSNPGYDSSSSNSNLLDISCAFCEVYPKVNGKTNSYKLYIPSDLTELNIRAVTEDINAYCDLPKSITLSADQEPEFTLTVTASDGTTATYSLKIKRLDKTTAEVKKIMSRDGFTTIVSGEHFYQKPLFITVAASALCGTALIAVALSLIKRLSIKAEDPDETDFFEA